MADKFGIVRSQNQVDLAYWHIGTLSTLHRVQRAFTFNMFVNSGDPFEFESLAAPFIRCILFMWLTTYIVPMHDWLLASFPLSLHA